jgi:hypothetical protein
VTGWLDAVVAALAAFGLSTGVARSSTVYALVSAGHVLGIALLVGPVLLADLRVLGVLRGLDRGALQVLRRTAMVGVSLAITTGVLLLAAKPGDYAANAVVWAKLAVIAVALANALRFERLWRRRPDLLTVGGGKTAAVVSILLWPTALLLGRWIAFV